MQTSWSVRSYISSLWPLEAACWVRANTNTVIRVICKGGVHSHSVGISPNGKGCIMPQQKVKAKNYFFNNSNLIFPFSFLTLCFAIGGPLRGMTENQRLGSFSCARASQVKIKFINIFVHVQSLPSIRRLLQLATGLNLKFYSLNISMLALHVQVVQPIIIDFFIFSILLLCIMQKVISVLLLISPLLCICSGSFCTN